MLRGGGGIDVALEVQKTTEGRLPHDLLADPHPLAPDPRSRNAELGLQIPARGPLEYLAGGQGAAANRCVRQRIGRIKEEPARARYRPGRPEGGTTELVPMVEQHVFIPRSSSQSPTGMPMAAASSLSRRYTRVSHGYPANCAPIRRFGKNAVISLPHAGSTPASLGAARCHFRLSASAADRTAGRPSPRASSRA